MKSFYYITLSDLMLDIRKNLSKIPHDIDAVIGVPRSGMIVASVISELINVPLTDLDSFVKNQTFSGGHRLELFNQNKTGKVLVCDDTTYSSRAITEAKNKLRGFNYEFIYCVAYLEGFHPEAVDIWLRDVSYYSKQDIQVIYEWCIFNHYPHIMSRCIYDIDGVLCIEEGRPDDSNEAAYEDYIRNAKPLFVPKVPIGAIVTYRITKYKEVTEEWLRKNGIKYNALLMFNADNWRERNYSGISPEQAKADFYKKHPEFLLFIESNDREAQMIHKLSGKQVLCTDTNIMYGN